MGMTNRCPGLHAYLGGRCDMYDLHNLQTTRLSNGNLTEAIDIIDRMFWVGITEYFDASICLLAYQLGQFSFKLCDCALKPKNVVEHKNVKLIIISILFTIIIIFIINLGSANRININTNRYCKIKLYANC